MRAGGNKRNQDSVPREALEQRLGDMLCSGIVEIDTVGVPIVSGARMLGPRRVHDRGEVL
jgi:hypothetical protein